MRQHFGKWEAVEDQADEWIRKSFEGTTKYSEKAMILTPWKLQMREQREVLTSNGYPEKSIRSGMYNRCANTSNGELNSRDGIARARSCGSGVPRTYRQEYGKAMQGDEE